MSGTTIKESEETQSQFISKIKTKIPNAENVLKGNFTSVFDITQTPKSTFVSKQSDKKEAEKIYELALGYATEIAKKFRQERLHGERR